MVYLAKDYKSNLIKIGYSCQPNIREKTLRAENPEVDIISILLGGRDLESKLHKQFKEKRIRGEWFALDSDDINLIISSYPNLSRKIEEKFLSFAAERLLETIKENNHDIFSPTFLSANVFCDARELRKNLDELKRKRLIKYTWKNNQIEIKLI